MVDGSAKYNAYSPAISQGQFAAVAPGGSTKVSVSVNNAEWANTPALGVMVVVIDNASGANEARLLPVE